MLNPKKPLQLLVACLLVLGLLGPAPAAHVAGAANLHPLVAQLAAAAPEQWVAVIVQKADTSTAAEAAVARLGGTVTTDLHIINAFAADMTAAAARDLAASPAVRWVSLDAAVVSTGGKPGDDKNTPLPPSGRTSALPPNYYLDTLRVPAVWRLGVKGQGITVAVIDSGISADADFGTRLRQQIAVNAGASTADDVFGHGTHVAGIIAGSGAASAGVYAGIAPEANLISLKISDDAGRANESNVVAAMQWVFDHRLEYNIRVVNLSINATVEQSYHTSPLDAAAEILWFNSVVVVTSAGNTISSGGWNNTVNAAPANDPFVISVGASAELFTSDPSNDFLALFSAYGTTVDGYARPDLVAPGTWIISVLSQASGWAVKYPERVIAGEYFQLSGTSMAAPMVAGAVALLLQDEPRLTPDQVKFRLINTSRTITGLDGATYRYLDVYAAVTGKTTKSANVGVPISRLLFTGSEPVRWTAVSWNAVSWNAVSWNAVSWNAVSWNAVSWNGIAWND